MAEAREGGDYIEEHQDRLLHERIRALRDQASVAGRTIEIRIEMDQAQ